MIKNVIFDIGDVLVKYNPKEYIEKLGMSQLKVNEANDILVKGKEWREYLNGNITAEEILEYFLKKYPALEQEFRVLLEKRYCQNIFSEIGDNVKLLTELSKKYNIYLLSNIAKESLEIVQEKFTFVNNVKGGVYSYIEHISKPDEKIYQILLNRYHLNANETIFIDDKKKNIDMANNIGIKGIQYQENISLKEKIGEVIC